MTHTSHDEFNNALHDARVMAVDDNLDNLGVLEKILVTSYAHVALFSNGRQALKAVATFKPDIILLDVRMPDIDGHETCRRLQADPQTRDIPVIFLSGVTQGDEIVAGFNAGGVDFVNKPIQETELLARINTQIRLHQAYVRVEEQNKKLHELESYRDTLVHMVVHDMRTPLQAMLGHLQLIEQDGFNKLDIWEQNSLCQSISATRLLSRMATGLIDISRLENKNMPIFPERVDLTVLLTRLIASELDLRNRNLTISVQLDEHTPSIFADPLLLERILLNLLDNALKHSPSGGIVTIHANTHPQGVCISIDDQGRGIDPENRTAVFQKFATVQTDTEYRKQSNGLGLTFCKLAVEAHGGTIGFENRQPTGCRFWFVLPADPRSEPSSDPQITACIKDCSEP